MPHVRKVIAALCLLCLCAAAPQYEGEMMPGIVANEAAPSMSSRRRTPVRVRPEDDFSAIPAGYSFLHRSWHREDAHHLNDIAPPVGGEFSGALLRNDVRRNEVVPVVFPDNVVGNDVEVTPAPREGDGEAPPVMSLNMNEMSMRDHLMMSHIKNAEDFARMFGVSLPPGGGGTVAASTSGTSGIAARFGGPSENDLPVATLASCTPESKTVLLKLQPELNVVFFPTCVRLKRCGGCCTGPVLKCRPTEMRSVKLKILKVEQKQQEEEEPQGRSADVTRVTSLRRRPKPENSRRRREPTSSYVIVEEEEHLNCSCQCRVQETDCNPQIHDYVPNECQCACKNQDEQGKCEQKSDTHYWHKDDCMCYCYHEETCSTGQIFDHNSCSCQNSDLRLRSGLSVRRGAATSAPVAFPAP